MHFETSAKTGVNVEEVFSLAAKEMHIAKAEKLKNERDVSNPYGKKKSGGSLANPSGSLSNSNGLNSTKNSQREGLALDSVQVMKTEKEKKCCGKF